MNKNLLRSCAATILIVEVLYLVILFGASLFQVWAIFATGTVILSLITAIGLYMNKKWSVILLWITVVFVFVTTTGISHDLPGRLPGDISWFVNLVLAIFLTIDQKRNKV